MRLAAIAICVVALAGAGWVAADAAPASAKAHSNRTRIQPARAPRMIYAPRAVAEDAASSQAARPAPSSDPGLEPARFSFGRARTTVGPYQRPYNPDLQSPDYARIGKSAVGVAVSFKLGS